jgi:hypothetical protein
MPMPMFTRAKPMTAGQSLMADDPTFPFASRPMLPGLRSMIDAGDSPGMTGNSPGMATSSPGMATSSPGNVADTPETPEPLLPIPGDSLSSAGPPGWATIAHYQNLKDLAATVSGNKRVTPEVMRQTILILCDQGYIPLRGLVSR